MKFSRISTFTVLLVGGIAGCRGSGDGEADQAFHEARVRLDLTERMLKKLDGKPAREVPEPLEVVVRIRGEILEKLQGVKDRSLTKDQADQIIALTKRLKSQQAQVKELQERVDREGKKRKQK
jgi:hypothetical protein